MQDMVPGKRSIRQIEISDSRVSDREPPPPPELPAKEPRPRRRIPRFALLGGAVVGVLLLGAALSYFFSGTSIVVFPKELEVTVDHVFKAFQHPVAGELAFQTMTLDRTSSESVPAPGEEEAEERASGQIIVYNNYSSNPQRLIRNTRFESTTGKIYRINTSIVVPGKKGTTPGTVEATVYADEPGESYNSEPTDFTIPGFKESPQYTGFYARSKTPLQGGFVGTRLTVDKGTRDQAVSRLHDALEDTLIVAAREQTPEGFELYPGAVFFTYESLPQTESAGAVLLQEKVVLHALLLNRSDLTKAIEIATGLRPAEGAVSTLAPDTNLVLTISEVDAFAPWEKEGISFTLAGVAHLIALFEEAALLEDLAGKSRQALPTVLTGYPGIDRLEVTVRPFWKQTFPTDASDMTLTTARSSEVGE
jgi:hypothetical protein